jgi:hypothetical protein
MGKGLLHHFPRALACPVELKSEMGPRVGCRSRAGLGVEDKVMFLI